MVFELLVLPAGRRRAGEGRARPAGSHLRRGQARHGGGYGKEGGGFLPLTPATAALPAPPCRRSAAAASACSERRWRHPPERRTAGGPTLKQLVLLPLSKAV